MSDSYFYSRLLHEFLALPADSAVDVCTFLSSRSGSPLDEQLAVLLSDQTRGWATGTPRMCDAYFANLPHLTGETRVRLTLVLNEFGLRRDRGERPTMAEYVARFPDLAGSLQRLLRGASTVAEGSAGAGASSGDDASGSLDASRSSEDVDGFDVSDWSDSDNTAMPAGDSSAASLAGNPEPLEDRFSLLRTLGSGRFGTVHLAFDRRLRRQVAIKIPNERLFQRPQDAEQYLAEARIAAGLDHPNIVTVHDVDRTPQGVVYVVSRFIDGGTLKEHLAEYQGDYSRSVRLVSRIARALQHAHDRRLIHRDVKPSNILIEEETQTPYLADFGLAVHELDHERLASRAGTLLYMSPEQVLGLGHKLDGRTDIFALGVVLYELLAGQRPFRGTTAEEIQHQIVAEEPTSPRALRADLPAELERICGKAMAKRVSERYARAADLAEELESFLATRSTSSDSTTAGGSMRPKGLRSFEAEDADFFLGLLPGPRNREGLPESVAFWKKRIESTDLADTFPVGLLYGPSGCGKSSLVRAGILPRLGDRVVAIYVEASAGDTDARILRALEHKLPELPVGQGLVETLQWIRRGEGPKVVIVLDQFEQWLHAHRITPETELVHGLLQCDGVRLQVLLLVRDDFAMPAARLMHVLETPIQQGQNFATVDLFERSHAWRILHRFGHAYGRLPAEPERLTPSERRFLDMVVDGLAEGDRVVPLRIALFAQMVKNKAWDTMTLALVGGPAGVGVSFLRETFHAEHADPRHRAHAKAAERVLRLMLPEPDREIKGYQRSESEILRAAGYREGTDDVDALLQLLAGELRLITPIAAADTEPAADTFSLVASAVEKSSDRDSRFYQLTHDYLVPSVRAWLAGIDGLTRRGRARLTLAERSQAWAILQEDKQLPSTWEHLQIRLLTNSRQWTDAQRAMMKRAARVHLTFWGSTAAGLLVLVAMAAWQITQQRRSSLKEQASIAVAAMRNATGDVVPYAIRDLRMLPEQVALERLREEFERETDERRCLSLALGLAALGDVRTDFLMQQIDQVAPEDSRHLVDALSRRGAETVTRLAWSRQPGLAREMRRRARHAIVALHLGDLEPARDMAAFAGREAHDTRAYLVDELSRWQLDLKRLHALIADSPDIGLRSALCLGVTEYASRAPGSSDRDDWIQLAQRWYRDAPDATTHAAAGLLLRRWNVGEPTLERASQPPSQRDWFMNGQGLTLVRIPAGSFIQRDDSNAPRQRRRISVLGDLWFADREVSVAQFETFLRDPDYPAEFKPTDWQGVSERVSPTPAHPVQQLLWDEAVMYCNWLSVREGLPPSYERMPKASSDQQWQLKPNPQGYRLPQSDEWEHACRAATTSELNIGNHWDLLSSYACIYPTRNTFPCGSLLPNSWGLFDTYGNVWEWCEDLFDAPDDNRVCRGSSWDRTAEMCNSCLRHGNEPNLRFDNLGLRPVLGKPQMTFEPLTEEVRR
jgi:serine/threonine protein kinase/formylglycine-generating enzyme required for sulfatase activity